MKNWRFTWFQVGWVILEYPGELAPPEVDPKSGVTPSVHPINNPRYKILKWHAVTNLCYLTFLFSVFLFVSAKSFYSLSDFSENSKNHVLSQQSFWLKCVSSYTIKDNYCTWRIPVPSGSIRSPSTGRVRIGLISNFSVHIARTMNLHKQNYIIITFTKEKMNC